MSDAPPTPEPEEVPVEPTAATAPPPLEPAPPSGGESQGAIIWREFRRRPLALLCFGIILLLLTVSVFAPLIANDRPLYYFGNNRFEYLEAGRTLRAMLSRLMTQVPRADQPDIAADIAESLRVIRLQVRLMAAELPPDKSAAMRTFGTRIEQTVAAPPSESVPELRKLQRELRSEFTAAGVELVPSRHWPVFAALNWLAVAFILANVLLLTYPLWRRLVRRTSSVTHPGLVMWITLGVFLCVPLIGGLAWWLVVPERVDRTLYKAGLPASDPAANEAPVLYETVVWPPIPYAIDEENLDLKFQAPAWEQKAVPPQLQTRWDTVHWLGTDGLGRDVLTRMIWGGRISLSVGVVAVVIYVTIGIVVGAVAGYFRGWTDMIVSRVIEVVICFPAFFLILTIVAFVGPSIINIMVVIGLTGWTGVARLVRGEFLRLAEQEFVLAGRALGYTPPRIIFRHILPNAMAPVLVSATFGVAGAILTESALSFLGLGISIPTPSWGAILSSGHDHIFSAPWLIWWPGLAIFVTITAYNLVGEALRDAADPRLRGSRAR